MNISTITEELGRTIKEFFDSRERRFEAAVAACVRGLQTGRKILLFGNGGSAAEAQHFAAELVNRFRRDRPPLRAVALSTDTSTLTSIGNDLSFDFVFSRQVEALGDAGDIALALSTSGNSPNVVKAVEAAKERGLVTIALTGRGGGTLAGLADYLFDVPSTSTPRIQEVHLVLLHLLAEEIENRLSA
jgi:D-sedoheptulose 7-phosphate isomerase